MRLLGILFLVGLIVCIRLLLSGLRGTTTHTPPWCAKCRFDLSGLTHPPRCPECGADLERLGAIRRTRTVRRRARLIVGALGTLIGAFILVHDSLPAALTVNWLRFAPSSTLSNWVKTAPAPDADRALAELQRRQTLERLTPASDGGLRAALLARITNQNAEWTEKMHNHLWAEYSNALMSPAESSAYEQAADQSIKFEVRPQVQAGHSIATTLELGPWRVGPGRSQGGPSNYTSKAEIVHIRRDGHPIDPTLIPTPTAWMSGTRQWHGRYTMNPATPIATSPGDYEITLRVTMGVTTVTTGTAKATKRTWVFDKIAHARVGESPTAATRALDLDTEQKLQISMLLRGVVLTPKENQPYFEYPGPAQPSIHVLFNCEAQALPVAFKATVRPAKNSTGLPLNDQEGGWFAWESVTDSMLGSSSAVLNEQWLPLALERFKKPPYRINPTHVELPKLPDLTVDVILTPDPGAAEQTVGMTRVPNCEIIYRDVPVYLDEAWQDHTARFGTGMRPTTIRPLDPALSPSP